LVSDGKLAASSAITERPCFARAIAAADPAQRAPTTTTSARSVMSPTLAWARVFCKSVQEMNGLLNHCGTVEP